MIPIVGPRTRAHLERHLGALDLDLEHYRRLDDVSSVLVDAPVRPVR